MTTQELATLSQLEAEQLKTAEQRTKETATKLVFEYLSNVAMLYAVTPVELVEGLKGLVNENPKL